MFSLKQKSQVNYNRIREKKANNVKDIIYDDRQTYFAAEFTQTEMKNLSQA